MKYKLIASDYDYTLAPTPQKASRRTTDAIEAFIKKGGYFVVATGRMTHGILSNLGAIKTNAPLVCYQGAKIIDLHSGKAIKDFPIDNQTALTLVGELTDKKIPYSLYYDDELFVPEEYEYLRDYVKRNNISYNLFPEMLNFLRDGEKMPTKVISIMEAQQAIEYEKEFSAKYMDKLSVTRSAANFLEFNSINAKKGLAVKYIADSLGISANEVICFGDSTNDASMLQYAGLGVAVGNAMEELKAIADLVCDTCANDGVAKVIEQYCLCEE